MEEFPCDPEVVNTEQCDLFRRTGQCFMDVHHLYYPRRAYRRGLEKEFRDLPENKVKICRDLHNEQHAAIPLPEKPPLDHMVGAIALHRAGEDGV